MRTLIHVLLTVDAFLALLFGLGIVFLSSMLLGSANSSDRRIGLVSIAIGILYVAGPACLGWIYYRAERLNAAALTFGIWTLLTLGVVGLLTGALEAAARP